MTTRPIRVTIRKKKRGPTGHHLLRISEKVISRFGERDQDGKVVLRAGEYGRRVAAGAVYVTNSHPEHPAAR